MKKPNLMRNAIALLHDIGFRFESKEPFGIISAESYNVRPDHMTPHFRDVFIGKCAEGAFYVTSNIICDYRRYKQHKRNTNLNAKMANIFGSGETPVGAVNDFLTNFKNKTYNVS